MLRTIRGATEVVGEDGRIGHVRRVLPEWQGATPTHVVVEAEKAGLVIVPLGTVKEITPERITVRMRRRHLRRMPRLRPDADLAAAIETALRDAPTFRVRDDLDVVAVRVVDGVAELHGNARSLLRALQIEQIALEVAGVTEIQNGLIIDDDLARAATTALQSDPSLQLDQLDVSAELGVLCISARAALVTDSALALLALRPIAGVRGVNIDIELPADGDDPDTQRRVSLHWWRPATSGAAAP